MSQRGERLRRLLARVTSGRALGSFAGGGPAGGVGLDRVNARVAGVVAVAIVAGGLWSAVDLPGLAVAVIVGAVWAFASPVYAVGVGGVLFATLLADGAGTSDAVAAASLATVFAADLVLRWPRREALVGVAVLVVATVGLAGAWLVESLVVAAVAPVVGFAMFAYALHRYALVRLGLLEEAAS